MSEENKAVFDAITEMFNTGDVSKVDSLVATDFIDHDPFPGFDPGIEGFRRTVSMFSGAFPDASTKVEVMVAEGDLIAVAATTTGTHKGDFMGMSATGKPTSVRELHIVRFKDGKAVEHWGLGDVMAMMQQLGVSAPMG